MPLKISKEDKYKYAVKILLDNSFSIQLGEELHVHKSFCY